MNFCKLINKVIAIFASIAIALAPLQGAHAADLNAEMDSMFNSLGGIGNYTAPGAFKSQALNTYAGGNIYLRVPQRSYQLASISWPTAKGSCGGVDVYGGSFSHIAAAEFRDALQRIRSALPGIAFQLAVDAVSPLFGSTLKTMTSLMTMVNNARINSCETASALVNSIRDSDGLNWETSCTRVASANGWAADTEDAKRMCAGNLSGMLDRAATDPNPAVSQAVPYTGNLTWELLKNIPSLDDLSRELIMNMAGTVIYYPASANREAWHIEATLRSIKDLLYGREQAGQNIRVEFYRCNNFTTCDNPSLVPNGILVEPMTTKVERLMRSISDHVSTRTPFPNNSAEVALVNNTTLPVYRILAVGNTIPNSGIPETLIAKYRDVIAADYAAGFMMQFTTAAVTAMKSKGRLSPDQASDLTAMLVDVRKLREDITKENLDAYRKVGAVSDVIGEMERLERSLRSNVSTNVLDMLAYSNRRSQ